MPSFRRLPIVSLLTAAAGAIHLAVAVPHFGGDPFSGSLFVVAGWGQLAAAALVLSRPTTAVASVTALVNLGAVAAWAVSRTAGLPLGHPGAEPVAVADVITVGFELAALGLLAARWSGWRRLLDRSATSLGAVGLVGVLAAGGSTAAIASLASGHPHGGHPDDARRAVGHHTPDRAGPRAGAVTDPAHRHRDGSWHLHASGEVHEHADGSIHVHGLAPADDPSPTGPAPSHAPTTPHSEGHDHPH